MLIPAKSLKNLMIALGSCGEVHAVAEKLGYDLKKCYESPDITLSFRAWFWLEIGGEWPDFVEGVIKYLIASGQLTQPQVEIMNVVVKAIGTYRYVDNKLPAYYHRRLGQYLHEESYRLCDKFGVNAVSELFSYSYNKFYANRHQLHAFDLWEHALQTGLGGVTVFNSPTIEDFPDAIPYVNAEISLERVNRTINRLLAEWKRRPVA